jgi:hypothetical protein
MRVDLRKIGVITITFSLILSFCYPFFHHKIVNLLTINFYSDRPISPLRELKVVSAFYFFIILLMLLGFVFLKAQNDSWRAKLKQIFLTEPLYLFTPIYPSPRFMLVFSTLIGLFLIILFHLFDRSSSTFTFLYKEDGLFESLTAILMIISMLFLGSAVLWLSKKPQQGTVYRYVKGFYILLMVVFFVYAMEEVSWGQRIFGWATPEFIEKGNIQNETNLHNFINAYFRYLYLMLILFPIPIFVSVWLEFKQYCLSFNRLILPHPSMIGMSLLIAIVALRGWINNELLEEMLALYVLFYSFRIHSYFHARSVSIFRYPDKV